MKSIVTGANGFIGSSLVRKLLEANKDVKALVFHGTSTETLDGLDIEVVNTDICVYEDLVRHFVNCSEVYHLAAYNKFWCVIPSVLDRVNYGGTLNVLKATQKNQVSRMVCTSTSDIVGMKERSNGQSGTEKDVAEDTQGLGPYARSKLLAEKAVMEFVDKGMCVMIAHPTIPIGPYDLAPTPPGKLIRNFLTGKLYGFLSRKMNFVDVRNCAQGHIDIMEAGSSGERYILGGLNIELKDFLDRLGSASCMPVPKLKVPYAAALASAHAMEFAAKYNRHEPHASAESVKLVKHSFCFSSEKAKKEIGYDPGDISKAIADAIEWHQNILSREKQHQPCLSR